MMETHKKHDHKECRKLLGSLSAYLDGELDESLCAALEKHMETCEDCRIVVDTLRKTVYLYHATSQNETLPSDIRARLYKSLNIDDYLEK
jgi:anti-sigma factor (TIGR02949 family)